LIRRYRWVTRSLIKVPRLGRRVHSFADQSACVFDIVRLALEAQRVISLRLAAIARGGPAAELETRLMVTEKMNAAVEAAGMLAQGGSTRSVISLYRSRVQANVRRLTHNGSLLHRAKQKLFDSVQAFHAAASARPRHRYAISSEGARRISQARA
jgi:hypothetical protein